MKNIQEAVNTIASKRGAQLDVVYPIDPTGVVTKVEDTLVTLTFLDTNSGISKQVTYPYTEVAFHKRRFGNAFTSVSSLRRMTARICLNLDLRLLRELIITLLYLFQKENVNVFKEYDVRPQDIVSFTKLIHVFYSTIASKSYIPNLTHLTPASALTYILKQTLIMMIKRESTPLLLPELMKDCWTVSPFGTLIHPLNNTRYYVESLHPYCARCKYHDKVLIPKAQGAPHHFRRPLLSAERSGVHHVLPRQFLLARDWTLHGRLRPLPHAPRAGEFGVLRLRVGTGQQRALGLRVRRGGVDGSFLE